MTGEGGATAPDEPRQRSLVVRTLDDLTEATIALPATIGVVADTHVPARARRVPAAALEALAGSDLILHAGDLVQLSVLDLLRTVAPVLAVRGNTDPWEVAHRLPRRVLVRAGRWQIGLVHGDGGRGPTPETARGAFETVDAVIFGHSHQPLCEWRAGVLLFNPGSATDRRRSPYCSCGRLRVTAEAITGEIIPL